VVGCNGSGVVMISYLSYRAAPSDPVLSFRSRLCAARQVIKSREDVDPNDV
jgi:hypothetical protein